MDVANTLLVKYVKSMCVCQFIHTFSHPLEQTGIRPLGFSNCGEEDVRFEPKNCQLRWGFVDNTAKTDGVRRVWVRVSPFLYI